MALLQRYPPLPPPTYLSPLLHSLEHSCRLGPPGGGAVALLQRVTQDLELGQAEDVGDALRGMGAGDGRKDERKSGRGRGSAHLRGEGQTTAAGPFPPLDMVKRGERRDLPCHTQVSPGPSYRLSSALSSAQGTRPPLPCPPPAHLLWVRGLPHALLDQVQTPRHLCAQGRGVTQFIQGEGGEGGRHMGGQPPTITLSNE